MVLFLSSSKCSTHLSPRDYTSRMVVQDEIDEDMTSIFRKHAANNINYGKSFTTDNSIAMEGSNNFIDVKVDSGKSSTRYSRRLRRHFSGATSTDRSTIKSENAEPLNTLPIDDEDDYVQSPVDSFSQTASTNHVTKFVAECEMPTDIGCFKMRSYNYHSSRIKLEPVVVIYGDIIGKENVLVRVHDQCLTSEVFGSMRCDCREQLKISLKTIQECGGVIIYLQQEGRGIGIANKIAAYALQDAGLDTVEANHQLGFPDEMREYGAVPDILKDLNIQSVKLLTNNPFKIEQLSQLGVNIVERVPIEVQPNGLNRKYLLSKRDRMRHFFSDDMFATEALSPSSFSVEAGDSAVNFFASAVNTETSPTTAPSSPSIASTTAAVEATADSETTEVNRSGYQFGKESVLQAIESIKQGKMVIVVDDADRENEGDFIMAAEKATAETIGFIVRFSSGVLCISLEGSRLDELKLPPMVVNNEDPKQTAYSVSVDYKHNTSTGISAADRALTFSKLCDPAVKWDDFHRPGHVFPLRYKPGGVLARAGHTEASLDLTRLAGLQAGGVLAEVVHDDGSLRRLPALQQLAVEHQLVLTSVQDIIAYRLETETASPSSL